MKSVIENSAPNSAEWFLVSVYELAVILREIMKRMHGSGMEADINWYIRLDALVRRLEAEYEGLAD